MRNKYCNYLHQLQLEFLREASALIFQLKMLFALKIVPLCIFEETPRSIAIFQEIKNFKTI